MSLMMVADSTQLSTANSLGCAPKAAPHIAGLSHTAALFPAALHSRTQLYSRRILAALPHAAALSPRGCTLTALLAAESHAAALSHSCLSRSWTLAHSCPSHSTELYSLTQLHSHSCTRCTLSRSWTLAHTMSDEACLRKGRLVAHPELITCDEDLPSECVVAHREFKRMCY